MKYGKKIVDKICALIESDDYSIDEVCKMVGINTWTFYEWKKKDKSFVKRIEEADEKRLNLFKKSARSGLLTLLNGKEYEEVTTEYVDKKVGKNNDGTDAYAPRIKSMKKTKKFILPNPTSVIFALKNLDPDNFKDIFDNNNTQNVKLIKVTKK
jgi:hypothetical protein